jgi:hypothetical protein
MAKKTVLVKNESIKSLDIKGKKILFCTLWAMHGHNAFPRQLREEYIERLWDNNPGSKKDIKKSDLLSTNEANEVLKKVFVYDKNLSIFERFVARFEQLSPKAIRLLKSPSISEKDIKKLQTFPDQEYSMADSSEGWVIQEVVQNKEQQKTKIIVSRRSARVMKARLKERNIAQDTWDKLESEVRKYFYNTIDSLQDVWVSVAAPYKFQVGIEFDWQNETTELLSDLSEWNEIEGKPDDRQKARNEALSFIAETVQLENKTTFTAIDVQGEIKDPSLRTKLERQNNQDYLVVMRGATYHVAKTETDNAEDVKATLRLFDLQRVTKAADNYFKEYKTFAGFFEKNKEFDRKRTRIQGGALGDEKPLDCTGIFLKVFVPAAPDAEPEIEAVSFEYQNDSGEWIIRTPDYSRRVRDAFVSELNKLSQKPAGYPRPKARKTP